MYLKANKRMKTIEQRAKEWGEYIAERTPFDVVASKYSYIAGANAQKDIDIDKAKSAFNKACGWLSTYTWYNEVFEEFRKAMEE